MRRINSLYRHAGARAPLEVIWYSRSTRLYVLESRTSSQHLLTPLPRSSRPMPRVETDFLSNTEKNLTRHNDVRGCPRQLGLERAVKAIALLDEVLSLTSNNREHELSVTHADEELRSLLGRLLVETDGHEFIYCGAIGITIRYDSFSRAESAARRSNDEEC